MKEWAFIKFFGYIDDPRIERTKLHPLLDIIAIAMCAVISGASDWEDIENYGLEKEKWLKKFLQLPNGIPSHDTFARVLSRINPKQFQEAFIGWTKELSQQIEGVIAIDGKTIRRSHALNKGIKALHLVSAWSYENKLTLGQVKVNDKSNEITAVPELLKLLQLKGAIVTLDAMGCQRTIAEQIHDQGGNYVLAVKDNQGRLKDSLEKTFVAAKELNFNSMVYDKYESVNGEHGRIEERTCYTLPLMYLYKFKLRWKCLQSLVLLESKRTNKTTGETTFENRYFISSLPIKAETIAKAIRQHWDIESNLHWSLDVTFKEDHSRIRNGFAPENFAWLRKMAFALLKRETSYKGSIKRKRFKALMDNNYLARVLKGI
jgi:predicted transposase YbfD/YdcC